MGSYKRIHRSLDRAYKKAHRLDVVLDDAKWVFFSDHHRGSKDQADDFVQCEKTYKTALNHYYERGFSLGLLGDVEELWENKISIVLKKYKDVIEQEDLFAQQGRLLKIWGNHDDYWREKFIFKHYFKGFFEGMKSPECCSFICYRDGVQLGEVVLVHGHQGSWTSEKFATASRFFVRYFWRYFQKWTGYKLTSASKDLNLKSQTDHAMYDWASKNERVLMCGHTHQPVFMSGTHLDYIYDELNKAQDRMQVENLRSQLFKHRDSKTQIHITGKRKPLYFNTGCCSFEDGDITGIEWDGNRFLLVKWSNQTQQRKVLNTASVEDLFSSTMSV
ncbi:MAG: hypothetical protein HRT74_08770 [Flavobacteriales bacterium]|nr:hypothetical protein [Flavobacteriales bacterium]